MQILSRLSQITLLRCAIVSHFLIFICGYYLASPSTPQPKAALKAKHFYSLASEDLVHKVDGQEFYTTQTFDQQVCRVTQEPFAIQSTSIGTVVIWPKNAWPNPRAWQQLYKGKLIFASDGHLIPVCVKTVHEVIYEN